MGIKVTVAGEPIALKPGQTFAWTLAYGTKPSISTLETTVASADRIRNFAIRTPLSLPTAQRRYGAGDAIEPRPTQGGGREDTGGGGPVTLLMEDDDNNRKVEIKGLYAVISNKPGADFNTRRVTLVDQRWLWSRIVVERSYNIRKKTGEFRLVRGERAPVQINRLRPDYGYRRATLKNGERPWTALEVLEDVLREICGPNGYIIEEIPTLTDTIEGLELHEPGPEALGRVLSYIPGARVYIGYDGLAHVASIYDGSERGVFESFGPGNRGDWSTVDKSLMRPSVFRVFSDREVELRFDHVETRKTENVAQQPTQIKAEDTADGGPGREELYCENVILNPLFFLPLDALGAEGAAQNEPVPLRTFIQAAQFLEFQTLGGNQFDPWNPSFVLTEKVIQDNWLGNWFFVRAGYALTTQGVYDPERLKIINALRTHYRQTYRILPQWRDKIRTLSADRAAILDFETGTRAPSPVFTQYITKWSQLGYSPVNRGASSTTTDDYADNIGEKDASPFSVSVIDSDMGLFRVEPRVDQTGVAETYMIGSPTGGEANLPSADIQNAAVFWRFVSLDPDFKLATIMTCTQDTPNSIGRLHEEAVTLSEAAALINLPAGVGEARGPDCELLQTAETARFAWRDDNAAEIRKAFFDGDPYPEGLQTNPQDIRALSVAAAAEFLVTVLDKVEGDVTGPLKQISPTGNLRTVTHFVSVGRGNQSGLFTNIQAPGDVPGPQIYSLLPEEVRRKVRRLVQP